MGFNYENTEIKTLMSGGGKVIRKVSIKNDKGYKSVTKIVKGKKNRTVKKQIHNDHIKLIQAGKFIPGLFSDCHSCKIKNKSRKMKYRM
jgi:hypothetical protein